jgi:GntR family transcriptional repressor for pyruvate dehydrogenase complex
MGDELFRSLEREALLSDRVADQIQELIGSRKLMPGEKLPPERELSELFGVSRTVVREAVKMLATKGLLEVRRGSGVVVTPVSPEIVSESIALFLNLDYDGLEYHHLAEVRQMVEIEIAGLAAQRATAEDFERMARQIKRMEELREEIALHDEFREQFARADVEFHLALAAATKNPLLPVLFSPLVELLVNQRVQAIDRPGAMEQGMLYHQDILDAVEQGDVVGAKEAMREHLEKSAAIMKMRPD